ncbi:MAG TPA: hypothetical protein VGR91_12390 [Stellaceae bacterium]|nr:hypothetical protein [Stellaceae bacterium]
MRTVRRLPPALARGLRAAGLVFLLGAALSGCVVAPGPGGWCYWHPHRCW